jgi:hypothetical protein
VTAWLYNNSSYGELYGIVLTSILFVHYIEYHSGISSIPASYSGEHGFISCLRDWPHSDWCHLWYSSVPPGIRSRQSSVGIATGYGPDGRGLIPGRSKIFYSPQGLAHLWVLPIPLSIEYPGV